MIKRTFSPITRTCIACITGAVALVLTALPAGADPSGQWQSDYGDIYFEKPNGDSLEGKYDGDEMLFGNLIGQRFVGYWLHPNSEGKCTDDAPHGMTLIHDSRDWGRVDFIFNETFTRFTGRWSDCGAPVVTDWQGSKFCDLQTHPGGTWTTTFGDMHWPEQSSGAIRGTYEVYGGRIIGELTGQTLTGTWVEDWDGSDCHPMEPVDGSGRHGPISMEFDPGFYHFNAAYGHCAEDVADIRPNWDGSRQCSEQPGEYPEWRDTVPDLKVVSLGRRGDTSQPPLVGQNAVFEFEIYSNEHVESDVVVEVSSAAPIVSVYPPVPEEDEDVVIEIELARQMSGGEAIPVLAVVKPGVAGDCHVEVKVTALENEADTANNTAIAPCEAVMPRPHMVVRSLSDAARTVEAEASLNFDFDVKNVGYSEATGVVLDVNVAVQTNEQDVVRIPYGTVIRDLTVSVTLEGDLLEENLADACQETSDENAYSMACRLGDIASDEAHRVSVTARGWAEGFVLVSVSVRATNEQLGYDNLDSRQTAQIVEPE